VILSFVRIKMNLLLLLRTSNMKFHQICVVVFQLKYLDRQPIVYDLPYMHSVYAHCLENT
jgi:hypothetical protein